ncbi:hypothetical protein F442_07496 [Phytophthora nicotianae P10297]|uniref:Uncharacterized protein n=1 Tax=Phytophthora nicotianae P10297 TaxID=1317064 RepID=W2ZFW0_PHYNI|nr:hypothetical protein F442_07496 [Phytophthora nicotianae P10297]
MASHSEPTAYGTRIIGLVVLGISFHSAKSTVSTPSPNEAEIECFQISNIDNVTNMMEPIKGKLGDSRSAPQPV